MNGRQKMGALKHLLNDSATGGIALDLEVFGC